MVPRTQVEKGEKINTQREVNSEFNDNFNTITKGVTKIVNKFPELEVEEDSGEQEDININLKDKNVRVTNNVEVFEEPEFEADNKENDKELKDSSRIYPMSKMKRTKITRQHSKDRETRKSPCFYIFITAGINP